MYTYHHPYTQYLREQECEDPWLFVEARKEPAKQKQCGKCWSEVY